MPSPIKPKKETTTTTTPTMTTLQVDPTLGKVYDGQGKLVQA